MNPNFLQTPIEYLKGVGPNRADLLKKELGIFTFQDLLNLFPNRYLDRTQYYKIKDLQRNSADVQVMGRITHLKTVDQKRGKRLVATFKDANGMMELIWFRGHKWIKENLKLNETYVAFGKTNFYNGTFSMPHPDLELLKEHQSKLRSALQPIYPSTEKLSNSGITNRVLSGLMEQLFLELKKSFVETLSPGILEELQLMPKSKAILNIHFPENGEELAKAIYRLKFEELFFIQLQLLIKNLVHKSKIKGYPFTTIGTNFNSFYKEHLPFDLTGAQKRVIKEIRLDTAKGKQMNRLLQGDVGSGKTMIALLSMLIAADNGFQSCIMAPTEILAQQHYASLGELLKSMPLEIALLTGSTKIAERRRILKGLAEDTIHFVVGTHAIIEDAVQFKNLGLAVIDEQHRFGVAQRAQLWKKSTIPPHVLVMTATPIPRTLAMTAYGDLDYSVMDELPPGRQVIKTVHRYETTRANVMDFVKTEIEKGRQAYYVYPLIEESEKLSFEDLMQGYEQVKSHFPEPKYKISMVHGRQKNIEKETNMKRFVTGDTQILVGTTVIEVGVNVPNASVMVIESAEKFGLSQLHQLRGRVGRGTEQSYCILLSSVKASRLAKDRLKIMCTTNDGFVIAEKDLELRGPGDIDGTRQSGALNFKLANIINDRANLELAKEAAVAICEKDPMLNLPEHQQTKLFLQTQKNKIGWGKIA